MPIIPCEYCERAMNESCPLCTSTNKDNITIYDESAKNNLTGCNQGVWNGPQPLLAEIPPFTIADDTYRLSISLRQNHQTL